MEESNLWLVIQWRGAVYELQGIYGSKTLADATCLTDQYAVVPMVLNERLPDENVGEWGYIPLAPEVATK